MQKNAAPMGHADSSKCPHCEYSESAAHMICSCPSPAYAKIRKEWQRDMHDTIEKAVPQGLASDLKQLWGTKDGKFVTWRPGHSPFSSQAWLEVS
jgi:hypothetical protein